MFKETYHKKKVLITGDTGFKGAWLTQWLLSLGAEVYGLAKDIPTDPSLFETLQLASRITHREIDVRDADAVCSYIHEIKPDYIFHLAAQPIVLRSYNDPLETFTTNTIGTANILEAARTLTHPTILVMITSDKCYENVEQLWGYRECDRLGGKDPYSASKGAAELVIHSYYHSFFKDSIHTVASVRAGNVIGGGDWAQSRIVPDMVRAWLEKSPLTIRNPQSTRPWQHVLEPVSGYLNVAAMLTADPTKNGESYNFGPPTDRFYTVQEVLDESMIHFEAAGFKPEVTVQTSTLHEANLLALNCDKAAAHMGWKAALDFAKTIDLTANWYLEHTKGTDMMAYTMKQISTYIAEAQKKNITWAVES